MSERAKMDELPASELKRFHELIRLIFENWFSVCKTIFTTQGIPFNHETFVGLKKGTLKVSFSLNNLEDISGKCIARIDFDMIDNQVSNIELVVCHDTTLYLVDYQCARNCGRNNFALLRHARAIEDNVNNKNPYICLRDLMNCVESNVNTLKADYRCHLDNKTWYFLKENFQLDKYDLRQIFRIEKFNDANTVATCVIDADENFERFTFDLLTISSVIRKVDKYEPLDEKMYKNW